jgi:hypothetical protein
VSSGRVVLGSIQDVGYEWATLYMCVTLGCQYQAVSMGWLSSAELE